MLLSMHRLVSKVHFLNLYRSTVGQGCQIGSVGTNILFLHSGIPAFRQFSVFYYVGKLGLSKTASS